MSRKKKEKPNNIQKFVRKGLADIIRTFNGENPKPPPPEPLPHSEAWYRDRLAERLKAKKEVNTPVGRIDILTETELIELKRSRNWKSAIGQVKSYGKFYPQHRLRIHLFREMTGTKLKNIQETCDSEGIILTWE